MPFLLSRKIIATLLIALFTTLSAAADGVRLKKVVIDAGHGGHDAGAISTDGKLLEKNVALDVALKLGERIKKEYPGVKVIYTRDKDVFIPLYQRADIANKNHADLFISVHCNSVPKTSKAPTGSETWIMGMNQNAANMEVCKRENSVILLEDDHNTRYQGFDPNDTESYILFNLMQNAYIEQSLIFAELCQKELHKGPISTNRGIKQGGFVVLWRTTMPSVLVELGFISNASDRATLASKTKRDEIAGCLFNAFKKFKKQYEGSTGRENAAEKKSEKAEPAPAVQESEPEVVEKTEVDNPADGNFYAVQIFAVSKELESGAPQFKGEKNIHSFKVGNVYKYTVGIYKTDREASDAASRLNEKFPGCFVVKIENFEIKKK